MTIVNEVKNSLEDTPEFRERRLKDKYLIRLILKKMGRESMTILPIAELADFAVYFESYNRAWRKNLHDYPELRGRDYEEKIILEQEKQIDLGYVAGFDQDIKKLKQLSIYEKD